MIFLLLIGCILSSCRKTALLSSEEFPHKKREAKTDSITPPQRKRKAFIWKVLWELFDLQKIDIKRRPTHFRRPSALSRSSKRSYCTSILRGFLDSALGRITSSTPSSCLAETPSNSSPSGSAIIRLQPSLLTL